MLHQSVRGWGRREGDVAVVCRSSVRCCDGKTENRDCYNFYYYDVGFSESNLIDGVVRGDYYYAYDYY